jgi:hypothetical protein
MLLVIIVLRDFHLLLQTHSFPLSSRSSIAPNQLCEDCSLAQIGEFTTVIQVSFDPSIDRLHSLFPLLSFISNINKFAKIHAHEDNAERIRVREYRVNPLFRLGIYRSAM